MKRMSHGGMLGLVAAGVLVAVSARADDASKPKAAAAPLAVDINASRVYVKVGSATRLGHVHGVQGLLASGRMTLGGPGELGFNMKTFAADAPEARSYVGLTGTISPGDAQKATTNMLGSAVLDVARFPTATYVVRAASPMDGQAAGQPGRYQLDGEFTLHGVGRKVPLLAVVEPGPTAGTLRMRTSFTIYQTHFGMTPYSALGGLVGVTDRLELWGDLILHQAGE